nr:hypothetical protein CFP56_06085 [Quercus suber]
MDQKTNINRISKVKNNTLNTALKQTKEQLIKSGAHHSKGSGSKENEETSSQSNKGSWRRLIRESPITVAMDRDSEVKGPKRKLVVPLGEVDQNVTQGKKVKIDFDEGEHYGALPGKLQDSINSMEFESLWPCGEEYRAHARKAIVTRSTSNGTFKPGSDNRDKNGVE